MSYRHWLIQTITVSYFWIVSGLEAISFLIFPSPMFLLEALWNPPKIGFLTTNWFWTHNWDTFLLHINYFLLMILICHSHHWRAVFRSHFFSMPNHATVTFFKKTSTCKVISSSYLSSSTPTAHVYVLQGLCKSYSEVSLMEFIRTDQESG